MQESRLAVWVLDDSPTAAEAVRATLAARCYVTVFSDGAAMLESLSHQDSPHVLVMDWEMPGMSGIEVCQFLRNNPGTETLPIILLTSNLRPEDVAEAMKAGANDYMFKPFRPVELAARVEALARWHIRRRQAEKAEKAAHAHTQHVLTEEQTRRSIVEALLAEVQAAEERASRSERRYQLAARATRDAIWELDPVSDTLTWSGDHPLLGPVPDTEVRSAYWKERIHPEERQQVVSSALAAFDGTEQEWKGEYRFLRANGTWAHVVDRAFIVRNSQGQAVQVVGAMRDVSERHAMEAERARLLEQERRANAEQRVLEAETRRRADFERQLIGIVSHDLRNPLTAITFTVALLKRQEPDERLGRGLSRIQDASERAIRMIRDLLDFTQARQGGLLHIQRQTVDLHAVVGAVAEELRSAHPGRTFEISQAGDVSGEWDPDRLAQVVSNLLGNAIQYGPAHTPIRAVIQGEPEAVTVAIHNEGEPIPADVLPRIFEPMERGAQLTDQTGRSIGLGLYIVRHIVQGHGGTVSVQSNTGGTTFIVRLPRKPAAP